jgi:hypothetical protein
MKTLNHYTILPFSILLGTAPLLSSPCEMPANFPYHGEPSGVVTFGYKILYFEHRCRRGRHGATTKSTPAIQIHRCHPTTFAHHHNRWQPRNTTTTSSSTIAATTTFTSTRPSPIPSQAPVTETTTPNPNHLQVNNGGESGSTLDSSQ